MAEHTEAKVGVSYIEVDRAVSEADLAAVQERCNEVIRAALPVTVNTFEVGDPELDQVRPVTCTAACHTAATCQAHTRGLPSDHVGPVRVVSIPGVDTNLCCGTHVAATSQLQMLHLMGLESKVSNVSWSLGCLNISPTEKQALPLLPGRRPGVLLPQGLCREREDADKAPEQRP